MKLDIKPGKYVLAVSGGVDSMVLLHLLVQQKNAECRMQNAAKKSSNSSFLIPHSSFSFVVAHFDHGIRTDNNEDERLVLKTAKKYGLKTEVGYGKLGTKASEETARLARYKFLESVKKKHLAKAIITAHHQDDLIETALLNLLRGSGRRGLSAIADSEVLRPLLGVPKADILDYAKKSKLAWHEDETNNDTKYSRNYLRHEVLPSLSKKDREKLISNLDKVAKINKELNAGIATLSQDIKSNGQIDRSKFTQLPQEVANEAVMQWLRECNVRQFDKKTVNRLSMAIKTGGANTNHRVSGNLRLKIGQKAAQFSNR